MLLRYVRLMTKGISLKSPLKNHQFGNLHSRSQSSKASAWRYSYFRPRKHSPFRSFEIDREGALYLPEIWVILHLNMQVRLTGIARVAKGCELVAQLDKITDFDFDATGFDMGK